MLEIKLDNGKILKASSAKTIVYKLMRSDFIAGTKTDYMREVQKRLKVIFDVEIKAENRKWMKFLDELDHENFITILSRR